MESPGGCQNCLLTTVRQLLLFWCWYRQVFIGPGFGPDIQKPRRKSIIRTHQSLAKFVRLHAAEKGDGGVTDPDWLPAVFHPIYGMATTVPGLQEECPIGSVSRVLVHSTDPASQFVPDLKETLGIAGQHVPDLLGSGV
jgi:hypothetical protein